MIIKISKPSKKDSVLNLGLIFVPVKLWKRKWKSCQKDSTELQSKTPNRVVPEERTTLSCEMKQSMGKHKRIFTTLYRFYQFHRNSTKHRRLSRT